MRFTEETIESTAKDIPRLFMRDGRPLLIFYQVYRGTPNEELEKAVGELEDDEVFYRVNLDHHSAQAYVNHCRLPDFYCEGMGIPIGTYKQIPMIMTFVIGMGPFGSANTIEEVPDLVVRARQEKEIMRLAQEDSKKATQD